MPAVRLETGLTAKQTIIARRRRQVAQMVVAGLTHLEIAEQLKVTTRTITSDVAEIHADLQRDMAKHSSVMNVAVDLMARARDRRRILYDAVSESYGGYRDYPAAKAGGKVKRIFKVSDPDGRVKAVKELRETDESEVKMLQSLGVVFKAAEKQAIEMRLMAAFASLPPDAVEEMLAVGDDELRKMVAERVGEIPATSSAA